MSLRHKIEREYFDGTPVRLVWDRSQWIELDGTLVLGARAGPELRASNLIHEMCHLVEIDDARIRYYGWGLRLPLQHVLGHVCIEPRTMQATARELRVMAYQANVMEHLGMRDKVPVDALVSMPDFLYVPMEDGRSAYGSDSDDSLSCTEKDASRVRWMIKQVELQRNIFTYARFEAEWQRKMQLLS